MGLLDAIFGDKLKRVEKKIKVAHARQHSLRKKLAELERTHKAGKVSEAEFKERREKLESEKSELTQRIKDLHAEEQQIRAQP